MFLTEDQVWALNEIIEQFGYNGGLEVTRPLFKRKGTITVTFQDQMRRRRRCEIGSVGAKFNARFV